GRTGRRCRGSAAVLASACHPSQQPAYHPDTAAGGRRGGTICRGDPARARFARGVRRNRREHTAAPLARVWNDSTTMIDLGWSAPTRRLDASTAREAILAQHHRIRALL